MAPHGVLTRGLVGRTADLLLGPHGLDRYLEAFRPTWSTTDARGEVTAVTRRTSDTVTLRVRPNRQWRGFEAGQFVAVTVEVDGVRRTRCYSPAGSAHDRAELEFTIKATPDGIVGRHLVDHAETGIVLGLSAAAGDFTLPTPRPDRLLLIGGGSGMTPLMSMVRTLADEGYRGPIVVLQYCPRPEDVLYLPELLQFRDLPGGLQVLIGHPETPGTGDLPGNLSLEHLRIAGIDPATFGTPEGFETYVCGPDPLMAAARSLIETEGGRVWSESFSLTPAPDPSATGTLRLTRSGVELQSDGRTILDQAEAAGLTPAYGCRRGICHTCVVQRTAGRVRDVRDGTLCDPDPGSVRICVSTPAGDVELDL